MIRKSNISLERLEPVSLDGGGLIGYFDDEDEVFYPLESLDVGEKVK